MKRNLYHMTKCSIFCLIAFFISCQKEMSDITTDNLPEYGELTFEEAKGIFSSMGYATETLKEFGDDSYLIEGDMLFYKSDLSHYKTTTRQQIDINDRIVKKSYSIIRYYINPSLCDASNSWENGIIQAMQAWNGIHGFKWTFLRTTTSSNADIILNSTTRSDVPLAGSYSPSYDGKIGTPILINVLNTIEDNYSTPQKKYIVAHEIGHTLGFEHPGEGKYIDGTPTNETSTSIMYAYGGGREWGQNMGQYSFTRGDTIAYQKIYRGNYWDHRIASENISGLNATYVIEWSSPLDIFSVRMEANQFISTSSPSSYEHLGNGKFRSIQTGYFPSNPGTVNMKSTISGYGYYQPENPPTRYINSIDWIFSTTRLNNCHAEFIISGSTITCIAHCDIPATSTLWFEIEMMIRNRDGSTEVHQFYPQISQGLTYSSGSGISVYDEPEGKMIESISHMNPIMFQITPQYDNSYQYVYSNN